MTATASRTKAGRQAAQKIDERDIVDTLLASPAKWNLPEPLDMLGLLKLSSKNVDIGTLGLSREIAMHVTPKII